MCASRYVVIPCRARGYSAAGKDRARWVYAVPVPRRLGRLLTDVRPLQASRDYRRLWIGNTVSQLGQQMTAVTIAIQVYGITSSTFSVGLVGLFALVPLVAFGLYGGAFADAVDRRKLALVSSMGLWLLSIVLVVQAVIASRLGRCALRGGRRAVGLLRGQQPDPQRDRAAADRAASCCRRRTRSTWRRSTSASRSARCSGRWRSAPAATSSPTGSMRSRSWPRSTRCSGCRPSRRSHWRGRLRPGRGSESVVEGFRFLAKAPNLRMTFIVDMCAMVLAQPRALFPAVAGSFFGGGVKTVGLLQASPAIGSLLAFAFSGWVSKIRRQGKAIVIAVAGVRRCRRRLRLRPRLVDRGAVPGRSAAAPT